MSDLAAIRERDAAWNENRIMSSAEWIDGNDRRALLAHIDALTAKVEGLPHSGTVWTGHAESPLVHRDAVLAILRGEA